MTSSITEQHVADGWKRGEFTWWTVNIYGYKQGLVLSELRATHQAGATWVIAQRRAFRVTADDTKSEERTGWSREGSPMQFDDAGCLAVISQGGYATFSKAQASAVAYYVSNTLARAKREREHDEENARTISGLLRLGDQVAAESEP